MSAYDDASPEVRAEVDRVTAESIEALLSQPGEKIAATVDGLEALRGLCRRQVEAIAQRVGMGLWWDTDPDFEPSRDPTGRIVITILSGRIGPAPFSVTVGSR